MTVVSLSARAWLLPRAALMSAAAWLALLAASPASAQGPANPNPQAVRAGAYTLEPSHTRVLFSLSHMGFTTWYGDFTQPSGSLRLDPAHPESAAVEVMLPVAGVETTNAKLDEELKAADWFDAARFPTARFVSKSVVVTGPGKADLMGELTLHGVTRPMVLHASFNGAGVNPLSRAYTVGFEAHGALKRSDYGVSKYVPLVGDEVELIISAAFEKAPS